MTRTVWRRLTGGMTILSGIAALAVGVLLTIDASRALVHVPRETAHLDALTEQAEDDSTVAPALHAEFDRVTAESLERDDRVAALSWTLLISAALCVLSAKAFTAVRRTRPLPPQQIVQLHIASRSAAELEATPPTAAVETALPSVDVTVVDEIVARVGRDREATIPLLHAIQDHYRYLPDEALRRLSELTDATLAEIAGVATFYTRFRRRPVGEHLVEVCHGTACHVAGAPRVSHELQRRLGIPNGQDTDPHGRYTIQPVPCLGCCTLAPVVQIDGETHGKTGPDRVAALIESHDGNGQHATKAAPRERAVGAPVGEIRVGLGSCCIANGSGKVQEALHDALVESDVRVTVKRVGCVGMCHQTPFVEVRPDGRSSTWYRRVQPEHVRGIVKRHFRPNGLGCRLRSLVAPRAGRERRAAAQQALEIRDPVVSAFLGPQKHIATEHCGDLDPLDLDEYLAKDGFVGLRRVLDEQISPTDVIDAIRASGLRGRGGAGFPTSRKWAAVRDAAGTPKYIICNGDEGDPGAFMDRMLMESYPYRIIEGMAIAAYATGATEGVFYIRAEYPLAVERIRAAIAECDQRGILGKRVLGNGPPLTLHVVQGAGAFVCGEETALIASLEGKRGMPILRPPYPAERGFRGQPTLVNNVETFAVVPWIMRHGPEAFASIGTAESKGTKVFALTGKIRRGGLIEVPMGVTVRQIVEDIGGGIRPEQTAAGAIERRFKGVQIGGPSGGCVPASLADTPVDYDALQRVGAMMGSGGLVVLDDSDCMVDVARYFLSFTQSQSCGKCAPCRIGTQRMLEILERICAGHGVFEDLHKLEELGETISSSSLCGLGKTAPNPVLSTLRYFRDEYEAHLNGHCPAGKCTALVDYRVTELCVGCTICAQHCPAGAIELKPYERHEIDTERCTRCDICRVGCPEHAIEVV